MVTICMKMVMVKFHNAKSHFFGEKGNYQPFRSVLVHRSDACRAKFNITGSSVKMADESFIVVNEPSENLVAESALF